MSKLRPDFISGLFKAHWFSLFLLISFIDDDFRAIVSLELNLYFSTHWLWFHLCWLFSIFLWSRSSFLNWLFSFYCWSRLFHDDWGWIIKLRPDFIRSFIKCDCRNINDWRWFARLGLRLLYRRWFSSFLSGDFSLFNRNFNHHLFFGLSDWIWII